MEQNYREVHETALPEISVSNCSVFGPFVL